MALEGAEELCSYCANAPCERALVGNNELKGCERFDARLLLLTPHAHLHSRGLPQLLSKRNIQRLPWEEEI